MYFPLEIQKPICSSALQMNLSWDKIMTSILWLARIFAPLTFGFVLLFTALPLAAQSSERALPVIEYFVASQQTLKVLSPVQLTWKVRNAVRVDISDSYVNTVYPDLGAMNSIYVYPERSARYTLYAYSSEGNVMTATIDVVVSLSPAFIDSLQSSTTLSEPRQPVRLWWRVTYVNKVDLQDLALGVTYRDLPAEGYVDVYPEKTSSYVLIATVPGTNPTTALITIRVKEYKPTIDYFHASATTLPTGEELLLRWQTTNAVRTEIFDGTQGLLIPVSPSGEYRINVQQSGIIYLYAYGDVGQLAVAQVPITVTPKPKP